MHGYEETDRTAANLPTSGSEPNQYYPAPPYPPTPGLTAAPTGAGAGPGWPGSPATQALGPTPPLHRPPRRWRRTVVGAAAILVLTGGAAGVGGASGYLLATRPTTTAVAAVTPATGVATSTSLVSLIASVKTQVVSIAVQGSSGADEGSGIIVRSDGTILTNNHVISAASGGGSITVTFSDGRTAPATVLAADATRDLALVKVNGVANLTAATLGDSGSVQLGETVVAIGNELGLPGSVSQGIVSGLNRTLTAGTGQGRSSSASTTYTDAIQTDAATNPGDSGGALFNTAGQVIGVNTAIASASSGSGSIGVGFAIPSNAAAAFIAQTLGQS